MVITMAKLRMAHASTHGARKPPGPKYEPSSPDHQELCKVYIVIYFSTAHVLTLRDGQKILKIVDHF